MLCYFFVIVVSLYIFMCTFCICSVLIYTKWMSWDNYTSLIVLIAGCKQENKKLELINNKKKRKRESNQFQFVIINEFLDLLLLYT